MSIIESARFVILPILPVDRLEGARGAYQRRGDSAIVEHWEAMSDPERKSLGLLLVKLGFGKLSRKLTAFHRFSDAVRNQGESSLVVFPPAETSFEPIETPEHIEYPEPLDPCEPDAVDLVETFDPIDDEPAEVARPSWLEEWLDDPSPSVFPDDDDFVEVVEDDPTDAETLIRQWAGMISDCVWVGRTLKDTDQEDPWYHACKGAWDSLDDGQKLSVALLLDLMHTPSYRDMMRLSTFSRLVEFAETCSVGEVTSFPIPPDPNFPETTDESLPHQNDFGAMGLGQLGSQSNDGIDGYSVAQGGKGLPDRAIRLGIASGNPGGVDGTLTALPQQPTETREYLALKPDPTDPTGSDRGSDTAIESPLVFPSNGQTREKASGVSSLPSVEPSTLEMTSDPEVSPESRTDDDSPVPNFLEAEPDGGHYPILVPVRREHMELRGIDGADPDERRGGCLGTRQGARLASDVLPETLLSSLLGRTEEDQTRHEDTITIGGTTYGLTVLADGFDLCKADGTCHRVTIEPDGSISCECKDWQFRRKGLDSGGCRHIKGLRAAGLIAKEAPPDFPEGEPSFSQGDDMEEPESIFDAYARDIKAFGDEHPEHADVIKGLVCECDECEARDLAFREAFRAWCRQRVTMDDARRQLEAMGVPALCGGSEEATIEFEPVNLDDCPDESTAWYSQRDLMLAIARDISLNQCPDKSRLVPVFRSYAAYSQYRGHAAKWREDGNRINAISFDRMADDAFEKMPEFAKWA